MKLKKNSYVFRSVVVQSVIKTDNGDALREIKTSDCVSLKRAKVKFKLNIFTQENKK